MSICSGRTKGQTAYTCCWQAQTAPFLCIHPSSMERFLLLPPSPLDTICSFGSYQAMPFPPTAKKDQPLPFLLWEVFAFSHWASCCAKIPSYLSLPLFWFYYVPVNSAMGSPIQHPRTWKLPLNLSTASNLHAPMPSCWQDCIYSVPL